ncbi:hypothetical protein P7H30_11170 [Streptococcus parauberis]|uniref:hypothetical protein n=1 Tax=Streptococcus parauberis TaxID=1348 RepID=UPI00288E8C60|nr:hypothetical protein [Streptococcus parauberis]MDT2750269.1 hypothetical protein [Streptococcus parauberis]
MLQFIKVNKKYLIWVILFGLAGVVISSIFDYLVKFMNAYPRLSRIIGIRMILATMIYNPHLILLDLLIILVIAYDLAKTKNKLLGQEWKFQN